MNASFAWLGASAFAAAVSFCSKSLAQSSFNFTTAAPGSENVDSALLDNMVAQIAQQRIEVTSFLLIRHGAIVYEGYYNGSSATAAHELNSMTKAFTSVSLGILMDKGLLSGGLDQRALGLFPELTPANPSAYKSAMTLRNVLEMSPGHSTDSWETVNSSNNWAQAFLDFPVVNAPGQLFIYDSGDPDFISAVIQKYAGQTLQQFAAANLLTPLGITPLGWEQTSSSYTEGSRGLLLTTRDMARFGLLCLNHGQWQGQTIVSKTYLDEATKTQIYEIPGQTGFWNSGYGFYFWMNDFGGYRADGGYGQYDVVLPDLDAVIVFTADNGESPAPPDTYLLENYAVPAIRPDPSETRAPTIVTSPVSLTANEGMNASFSVQATGQNLRYTWYHDGVALRDEHASTLTLNAVVPASAGDYKAAVGNTYGTVLSSVATLKVQSPTATRIASVPPALSTVPIGGDLTLSVELSDSRGAQIQWRHQLKPITGATSASYTIASAAMYDHGEYDVVITDSNGSTVTAPFFVNVYVPNAQLIAWGIYHDHSVAPAPSSLQNIAGISASSDDLMGLAWDAQGSVQMWGQINYGKDNQPSEATALVEVTQTVTNILALRADGTVISWGKDNSKSLEWQVPSEVAKAVSIASGTYRNYALLQDGSVQAWGYGQASQDEDWGQGDSTSIASLSDLLRLPPLSKISGTGGDVQGMTATGKLVDIATFGGSNAGLSPDEPTAQSFSSGQNFGLAVKPDGTVFAWGVDTLGSTEAAESSTHVVAVAAGSGSGVAVRDDGTVAVFGYVTQAVLPGGLDHIVAASVGGDDALLLRDASGRPWIISSPMGTTVAAGGAATFVATSLASAGNTDQWESSNNGGASWTLIHDGGSYSGTSTSTLTVIGASGLNGTLYRDRVTNGAGSMPTKPAQLSVTSTTTGGSDSKMINISTRSGVGTGQNVLIAGFVISGPAPKKLLLRAAGPALSAQGVTGTLPDPILELHDQQNNGTIIATNDNWDSSLATDFTQVGTSVWPAGSKDAAMVVTLPPGSYTAIVKDKNGASGIALVEVYEYNFGDPSRLVNLSSRSRVGTGASVQIAGIIINGPAAKRVLIRANGPALTAYGVSSALADPVLELHNQSNGGAIVATNDDWDSTLALDFEKCGASSWPSGSKDAALAVTLAPGAYTALVRGKNGGTGVALIEVFEEP